MKCAAHIDPKYYEDISLIYCLSFKCLKTSLTCQGMDLKETLWYLNLLPVTGSQKVLLCQRFLFLNNLALVRVARIPAHFFYLFSCIAHPNPTGNLLYLLPATYV